MGVYIPNMSKPKDCEDCMFNFYGEADSCPACYLTKHIVIRKKEENIPTDCPLIEIDETVIRLGMKFCGLVAKVDDIMKAENGERRADENNLDDSGDRACDPS